MKNHTAEFQSIVESVKQRVPLNGQAKMAAARNAGRLTNASGFTKMAASVGRDIQSTAAKLEKLTKR